MDCLSVGGGTMKTTKGWVRFIVSAALVLIITAVGVYHWSQTEPNVPEKPPIIDASENISAQFSTVRVIGRKQGEKQYDMSFAVVEQLEDSPVTLFSDLKDGKFFSSGEVRYLIDAGRGRWYQNTDDLDMFDGVVLRAATGELMTAPALQWKAQEEVLVSLGKVNIQNDQTNIDADAMTAYLSHREVLLEGNVTVVDEGGMVLRGNKALYSEEQQTVELFGPAEIEVDLGGGSRRDESGEVQQTTS